MIGTNIFGAVLAFSIGVAIAAGNYALSRYILKSRPERYTIIQLVRQSLQIAYLVILFVLGSYTPWDRNWLLVGGCLGVTLPMIWFTYQLVKLNDSLREKEGPSDG